MRILKSNPLLRILNSYLIDSSQPINLSFFWNFGSLLAFSLLIQIVTGIALAMHYNPNVLEAFNSVEHIMRDVNNGWLLRYLHSNTASAFFLLVYFHIARNLYYGSYNRPRTLVWVIGTFILLLMMATAFLGYVLPYGQMSLWGATVITNLMSALPWLGQDIVEFIWGGFSVNNATLNRFFALHFLLPFVLAAFAIMHLISLHDTAGSGNPLGIGSSYNRIPFAPYYIFKDLITIFFFMIIITLFVYFMPNVLGESDNYIMANPMQTPPAIVPEWYLLPYYAILRSIPNKLAGVMAMFAAILILLIMPFVDLTANRGNTFRPLKRLAFFLFVVNFLILMQLGAKHVESPYIELGQISTIFYFLYFLIIIPVVSLLENTWTDLNSTNSKNINKDKVIYFQPGILYTVVFMLFTVYVYYVVFVSNDTLAITPEERDEKFEFICNKVSNLMDTIQNKYVEILNIEFKCLRFAPGEVARAKFILTHECSNANSLAHFYFKDKTSLFSTLSKAEQARITEGVNIWESHYKCANVLDNLKRIDRGMEAMGLTTIPKPDTRTELTLDVPVNRPITLF